MAITHKMKTKPGWFVIYVKEKTKERGFPGFPIVFRFYK
jgi:hypothetical protein